jgi:hypothetical protein
VSEVVRKGYPNTMIQGRGDTDYEPRTLGGFNWGLILVRKKNFRTWACNITNPEKKKLCQKILS